MKKIILALTLAAAFTAGSAQALLIDDFSADSEFITAPGGDTTTLDTSSDFSLERHLSINRNPIGLGGASVIVTGGLLGISTGFGTGSDTTSTYSNSAGFDFTVTETAGSIIFNAFVIDLLTIDQGGVEITLTVDGISSTKFFDMSDAGSSAIFAHSLFGDVSDVNDIELFIHNNIAVDATFDQFQSFGNQQVIPPIAAIPEPASLALIGMGLLGFVFGRRKVQ